MSNLRLHGVNSSASEVVAHEESNALESPASHHEGKRTRNVRSFEGGRKSLGVPGLASRVDCVKFSEGNDRKLNFLDKGHRQTSLEDMLKTTTASVTPVKLKPTARTLDVGGEAKTAEREFNTPRRMRMRVARETLPILKRKIAQSLMETIMFDGIEISKAIVRPHSHAVSHAASNITEINAFENVKELDAYSCWRTLSTIFSSSNIYNRNEIFDKWTGTVKEHCHQLNSDMDRKRLSEVEVKNWVRVLENIFGKHLNKFIETQSCPENHSGLCEAKARMNFVLNKLYSYAKTVAP
ncbi:MULTISPECIES: hypothetical protein [unclassified Caballeronia]|uniref:hypothetical protein n=1 Tax=unclassified Caballeronia TaxID=2646786 RepID=UPI0020279B69|nr:MULTISPECIES: hypothetical protein [unclassified Caballeronia]